MSSAKVQITGKSSSTPFIKKIYEAPKKWLAGDKSKAKRDIVIIHRKTDHIYENVNYKNEEENKKKDENVTVVSVPYDKNQSNKLRLIIDNFDKILDEYNKSDDQPNATSTPLKNPPSLPPVPKKQETKIPKLIKAKTCSIIESKCILKKANANSTDPKQHQLKQKTKSMSNIGNIDQNLKPFIKTAPTLSQPVKQIKVVVKVETKKEKKENVTTNNDNKVVKTDADGICNVKEMVKRLNSLTGSKEDIKEVPVKAVSKAKSTLDLSSNKLCLASKIPVNTNLRKTYPSIPCDLNSLDSDRGNAGTKKPSLNGKFAKSSQNLASNKLLLPRSNKSVQNLTNRGRSTQNLSLIGRSSENSFAKSVQNLNKIVPSSTLTKSNNNRSVQNLASKLQYKEPSIKPPVYVKSIKTVNKPVDTDKSKSIKPIIKQNKITDQKQTISVTKSIEKLTSITKKEEVSPKDTFIVLKAPKEKVKTVIQKLEENKSTNNSNNLKPRPLKTDTYKVSSPKTSSKPIPQKTQADTKMVKNQNVTNKGGKRQVETIKLNLKNTQQFLEKLKIECNENIDYKLNPSDFNKKGLIQLKKDGKIGRDIVLKKDLDYNSDNSDDSGNISNEIELDCEDTNLSSSVKSSESLNTVLDISLRDQDSGIDLTKHIQTPESKKIFFRNGVISQLETQRDERLAGMVVHLQANCRGYLARKKLTQKKLQDLAVRCIQRNVRKFIAVRDWPWWRLLVRVTPLLNVYRTEEELKIKSNELEAIKLKLEKLENERTKLKHDNDKLEAKMVNWNKTRTQLEVSRQGLSNVNTSNK